MFFSCCSKQNCPKELSDRLLKTLYEFPKNFSQVDALLKTVSEYKVDQETGAKIINHAMICCSMSDCTNVELVKKIFDLRITTISAHEAKHGKGMLLNMAVTNADHHMVTFLLKSGLNPNQCIDYKRLNVSKTNTALHTAIHHALMSLVQNNGPNNPRNCKNFLACAEALIQHGADINARSDDHGTPLEMARSYENTAEVVEFLEKHGARRSMSFKTS